MSMSGICTSMSTSPNDGRFGCVSDGFEATAAIRARESTRASMPGLNGLEVAEAIRARGYRTPIVMISGHAEPADQLRAVQAGLRFARKPITFAQFEAMMAEVVRHAAAG
jgi:CheY-like chemotaxis protein